MPADRKEYMKDYMARRRAEKKVPELGAEVTLEPARIAELETEVTALRAEVKFLKGQLALKGSAVPGVFGPPIDAVSRTYTPVRTKVEPEVAVLHQFGAPRPAPKPGKKG